MAAIIELIDAAYRHWDDPEILVEIGEELEARSRLDYARKFLERALTLDAVSFPNAYYALAFTYFRDNGNHAEDGENALMDGIEATDSDTIKAWYAAMLEDEVLANTLISQVSGNQDISFRFALGGALHWRGRAEESLAIFRETIAKVADGETPEGLDIYCRSLVWMHGQGFDIDLETEVKPRLIELVRKHPDRYSILSITIQYYQVLREWKQVIGTARHILSNMPDEETTMLAMALAYRNLHELDNAALWANRAIGAKPSFARARAVLAAIYEAQGKPDLAELIALEIPVMNPTYHVGKIQAADVLRRLGKKDEALALFHEGYKSLKPYEKGAVHETHSEICRLAKII